ncbi:uncharacterized protein BcabD6B2_11410 [Babesia caballi]|uniref:Uncharacterized protein n=1 Tax=Babesia caballi TaxID=5871 RepID=A0AAV4LRK7_BABCB|nr:hypothetical protein, conserved [Babesia caballi]
MGGPTNPSAPSGAADQPKAPLLKGIEAYATDALCYVTLKSLCDVGDEMTDLHGVLPQTFVAVDNNNGNTDMLNAFLTWMHLRNGYKVLLKKVDSSCELIKIFDKYHELSATSFQDGITPEEATAAGAAMDGLEKQFRCYEGDLDDKKIDDTLKSCNAWIDEATGFIAGFKHEDVWAPVEKHHYASGRSAESSSNTNEDDEQRLEPENDIFYLFSNDRETAVGSGDTRDAATVPGAQQTTSGSTSGSFGDVDIQGRIINECLNNKQYYNDMYQAKSNVKEIQGFADKLLTEETFAKVQSNTDPEFENLKEAYEVTSEAYNELLDQMPIFQLVWDTYREYNSARRELTRKELTEVEKAALTARMSDLEEQFRGNEGFLAYGRLYAFNARCEITLLLLRCLNEMVEKLSSEEANVTGGEAASPIPPEATTASSDNGKVAGKGTEDASEIKEPSAAATAELDNNGHVNEMASTGGGILRGAPVTTANNSASSDKAASPTPPEAATASPRSQEHVEQDTDAATEGIVLSAGPTLEVYNEALTSDTPLKTTGIFPEALSTAVPSGLTFPTGALPILAAVFIMAAV